MKTMFSGTALSLFELALAGSACAAPTETVLHAFTGSPNDGSGPFASLIADNKGNLYGITLDGGAFGLGTVFKVSPPATVGGAWTETVLYSFQGGNDGAGPTSNLISDSKGNLYGVTVGGGESNAGVVFELSSPAATGGTWAETVLHTFTGDRSDGAYPSSGLIADSKGNLYGTTGGGGSSNYGTVFVLSPPAVGSTWTETVLYSFAGYTYTNDGAYPSSGLIADSKGNLYGTTGAGGASAGDGIVFELSPPATTGGAWIETVLYNFKGSSDGAHPYAGLIADSEGNLYGTTEFGGNAQSPPMSPAGDGVVFELSPAASAGSAWRETVLHSFTGGNDGRNSISGLIADSKGNLYGTALGGGAHDEGVVFVLSPSASADSTWTETVLHTFTGDKDGGAPVSSLIADSKGNLYGTTDFGGASGNGTVFELTGGGFVTETPFAAFRSNLELQFGRRPNKDAFELLSEFTLGSTSTGINPLTDPLTLTIGSYTATLAPGSFRRERNGQFTYAGSINGVDLEAALAQTGNKRFEFAAEARKADLTGTTNPVPVTLTIGSNTGTDSIKLPMRGW